MNGECVGTGLHRRDLKLAMSLKGSKGRKNAIDTIFPRHFLATAKEVGFNENRMIALIDGCIADTAPAIERVARALPADFSPRIADTVFENTLRMLARLKS
ncbi:hypothetical protein [Pantoea eucrina]|uniref:hypothetical protein n=1 Tax=Pantoea TaxID=53335 RepID=UPI002ACD62F4|nr:hypothetical protein [Pantoea eucrina]